MEVTSLWFSIVSIVASISAVVVSWLAYRGTRISSIRPTLVFQRRSSSWQLRNIGSGPALDVKVGDYGHVLGTASTTNPLLRKVVTCYPLAVGDSVQLEWILGDRFTASYKDSEGRQFLTHHQNGRSIPRQGRSFGANQATAEEWVERISSTAGVEDRLKEVDLEPLSAWELDLLRNEPYARHGYKFQRKDLAAHFASQPWYKPTLRNQFAAFEAFTPTEKYNVELILQFQRDRGRRPELKQGAASEEVDDT